MSLPHWVPVCVAKWGRGVDALSAAVTRPTENASSATARTMKSAATRREPDQLCVRGAETAIDDMDCLLLLAARGVRTGFELCGSTIGDSAPAHIGNPA
jgi:hypothetical protein